MIRINLLGHETSKPKKKRAMPSLTIGGSDSAGFILAIVVTVVLLAGAWWWQRGNLQRFTVIHTAVVAEQAELADIAEQVRNLEDRRAFVAQKRGVIIALKKSQSGPVLLLDQLNRELPDSLWLTDLTLDDGNVSIIGLALSPVAVADFVTNLRLSSYFADTDLDFTQDTGDAERFQLTTRFVPLSSPPEDTTGTDVSTSGQ